MWRIYETELISAELQNLRPLVSITIAKLLQWPDEKSVDNDGTLNLHTTPYLYHINIYQDTQIQVTLWLIFSEIWVNDYIFCLIRMEMDIFQYLFQP